MYKQSILLLLLALPWCTWAQPKPSAVSLALINEATAIPFTQLLSSPVHPGIRAGTDFMYRNRPKHQLYQSINIGYVYHRYLYHGLFINTELGYDRKLAIGFNLKGALGIGYLHTFGTQQAYRFQNGQYQKWKDRGNSRVMASLSTGLGYRLQKKSLYSPEIFMLYTGWAEYPYSPGFIPIMAHINSQVGAKFFIHQ